MLSTQILAALLNTSGLPTHWVDARDVVLTDDIFREGWVQWEATEERAQRQVLPLLQQGGFVLTQGFIASTTENFTVTLGRDGSDYTGAIFSYCLDAEGLYIWKDVPGVLTADPRLFDNVTKLDRLSYREAIEMTYYGAKVIHPKTIKPLQNKNIPLYVKSFIEPDAEGSLISDEIVDNYPPIVTIEKKQALCSISARDFSFVAEHHINRMFEIITQLRLQVNMMQNTALSFNVCFNDIDDKVDRFAQLLDKDFRVNITRGLEVITIRHYDQLTLESMKKGKMVLVEERLPQTILMVVKDIPVISWKEE
ncbi:MAG: aspartate kinase [Saprospiraceae bacterium]